MWSISKSNRVCLAMFWYAILSFAHANEIICTYTTWDWDTVQRKPIHLQKTAKPKTQLTPEEQGPPSLGCSVCEEDQVEIQLSDLPDFKICKKLENQIKQALQTAQKEGFPIFSIVGYRVGKSKGALSSQGIRTQFSNHSYGTAIDINAEKNGLYDHCMHWQPDCRLIRGGAYNPTFKQDGTITPNSSLYKALLKTGFHWGGDLEGKQKDFMHFSMVHE